MKKYLIGGAAAALIAGSAALAQTAQPAPAAPHPHMMKTETRADVQAHVARMFAKLDANHDGFVTKDEVATLEAQHEQKMAAREQRFDPSKMFDRLDLNHDGQITAAEAEAAHSQHAEAKGGQPAEAHAAGFSRLFQRADANHDGVITRAEFDAMAQTMKAHMEQAGMHRGGFAARLFELADANKDGRVSLAEAQQFALQRFDQIDLNHDGQITPEERAQAHQLLKGQRQPH